MCLLYQVDRRLWPDPLPETGYKLVAVTPRGEILTVARSFAITCETWLQDLRNEWLWTQRGQDTGWTSERYLTGFHLFMHSEDVPLQIGQLALTARIDRTSITAYGYEHCGHSRVVPVVVARRIWVHGPVGIIPRGGHYADAVAA